MLEFVECLLQYKVLLTLLCIFLFYKLGTIKHKLHLKLGHRGPRPLPYIGNFLDVYKWGLHEYDRMCRRKYGKIYPFYSGNVPMSIVADEELLKQILIKGAKSFTDRFDIGIHNEITEKMLNVLKGKDWERVRNLISPTFTSGKLRKMSPLISDGIDLLTERISLHPANKPLDIKEFFGALTIDVIARTMFGMHIDSQTNPNNQFVFHTKKLFTISLINPLIVLVSLFPKLAKLKRQLLPKWTLFSAKTLQFLTENLQKAIDERVKSTEKFNDFLALMLTAHKKDESGDSELTYNLDSKSLTNQEIMAQSILFLLAGYLTTAMTLTYVAYFLAKNPDVQQELYNEIIDSIGNEGDIKYEILMNMPFLDAVICETLRICPPAARTDRVCSEDIILTTSDDKTIFAKKGDIFTVPIYAIHTDSSIWPNPDTFDPSRFSPENRKKNSPYSFMPFGMGPRNCVGMRFALLEIKWAIVDVLRKFELTTCPETLEEIKFRRSRLSAPVKPILLNVIKR